MVRVYVPSTLGRLAAVMAAGVVPGGPGHAVTPALREAWPEVSEEEGEYAALADAADASAALLAAGDGDAPRRVVLVLDLPDADVAADPAAEEVTAVLVAVDQPVRLLAAVQADTEDLFATGPHDAPDLGWYAAQEVPELLASARLV